MSKLEDSLPNHVKQMSEQDRKEWIDFTNRHGVSPETSKAVVTITNYMEENKGATRDEAIRYMKDKNKDELYSNLLKHHDKLSIALEKATTVNMTLSCEEVIETFPRNEMVSLALTVQDFLGEVKLEIDKIMGHAQAIARV